MKGNMVLQGIAGENLNPNDVFQRLNILSIPGLLQVSQMTIGDLLLDGYSQGLVLWDAGIERYNKGANKVMDTLLYSIGLKLVKIVDDKGTDIIELNNIIIGVEIDGEIWF